MEALFILFALAIVIIWSALKAFPRCWNKFSRLFAAIVTCVLVTGIGVTIPVFFINNGLEHLRGEKKIAAEYSLLQTRLFIGGSLEPLFLYKLKVVDVEPYNGIATVYLPPPKIPGEVRWYRLDRSYKATVQSYTIFGLKGSRFYCNITDAKGAGVSRVKPW
jgi:hypothetical protein